MALQRTQKNLAKRIDQTYFQKPHPWRRARKALVFLFCAAAVGYLAFAFGTGRALEIHNPGHVIPAHASFENNCALCHQGKAQGGFSLTVTDDACLKCHQAAVHHQNQASQVMFDAHHVPVRAADCVECHVEHRGVEIMTGGFDQYCTQCHANLGQGMGKTLDGTTQGVAAHVTAFTAEGHPHFGRQLMKDGKMFDPTVLNFDHTLHLGYDPKAGEVLKGGQKNCTWCHTPGNGDESTGGDPAAIPIATADFKSLRQVNYQRNCSGCHDLGTLPGSNVPVPHRPMAEVRAAIMSYVTDPTAPWQDIKSDSADPNINTRLEDFDNAQTPLDKYKVEYAADMKAISAAVDSGAISPGGDIAGTPMSADAYNKIVAAITKKYPGTSKTVVTRRAKYLKPLAGTTRPSPVYQISPSVLWDIRNMVETKAREEDRPTLLTALAKFDRHAPDPRLLQFYVAEANGGASCIECHGMQGDAAGVPQDWVIPRDADASNSDTAPATQPVEFETVPTGIPNGPRKWFVNSEFNHDAHRSMNCVECHAAALTSDLTSTVLFPDYQWQGYNHEGTALVTRSCFECHHAADSSGEGARANCTECHVYHDRSLEPVKASGPPPATRPAVVTAGP